MNAKRRTWLAASQRLVVAGLGTLGLGVGLWGQAAQTPPPRMVEVPVRVAEGLRFIDTLGLKDFEVLENGRPQQIDAMFLVNGPNVVRQESPRGLRPDVSRSYYMLFQTVDWDSRLGEAVDYLFSSVLRPGDAMTLITPMKPYTLQGNALARRSKEDLSKSMQNLLRKDIQRGGGEYRDILKTLRRVTNVIDGNKVNVEEDLETDTSTGDFGLEQQLDQYRNALMKMESLRLVDERRLLAFADALRTVPGRKIVYFFYEREYRPEISPSTMQALFSLYQDNPTIQGNLMDLFQFYKREASFDPGRVKQAFSDASIVLNFIFMDKKSTRVFGANMREQSEDIFPGFTEVSKATGGYADVSQNAGTSFKRAADSESSYYLLMYTPFEAATDGAFRTIEVRVKPPDGAAAPYKVTNRAGYFAR